MVIRWTCVFSPWVQCSIMLCVTGNVLLLERSYEPGFLSQCVQCSVMLCVTGIVVLLECSYGWGFLSVRPVFYHAVYHRERCVVRAFLRTGFSRNASSVVMLCITGSAVLLERSYGPGFLSVQPVFCHAVCHREHFVVRVFFWTGSSLSAASVLTSCVSQGTLYLLESSYGLGFLSVRPVFYNAVCHRECLMLYFLRAFLWTGFSLSVSSVPHAVCHMGSCVLECSYGPGFLSVRPVFYHVERFWERCFIRAFLWTGFSLGTASVLPCCVLLGTLFY